MPQPKASPWRSLEACFGEVLREYRKKAGLSQDDLAAKAGYHRTYVSQIERGEKNPSLRTLFDLAEVLRVSASSLVKRVEEIRAMR